MLLDEWFEKKVDEACEAIPAYANPRKIRLANSAVGWRLYLYGSSMKRAVMSALVHIRSEDDINLFDEGNGGEERRRDGACLRLF